MWLSERTFFPNVLYNKMYFKEFSYQRTFSKIISLKYIFFITIGN